MIKTVQKYILKEVLPPIALSLILFTFILLLDRIFDLVDLYFRQGVKFFTIIKLLGLILPSIFSLTIPMAMLLGLILGFGRLSEDGEITAYRSSGQSLWHVIWPILLIALLICFSLVYFNSTISPKSHDSFKSLYIEALKQKPLARLEEKTFMKLPDYNIYIKQINRKTGRLDGVFIYKLNPPAPPEQIFAKQGFSKIDPDTGITFELQNGHMQRMDPEDSLKTIFTAFKAYTVTIPFRKDDSGQHSPRSNKNLRALTTDELKELIAEYNSKNLPTSFIKTELYLRYSIAFTPLVFAVIGIALGIKLEKSNKSFNFGISLVIIFIFYLLLIGSISISERAIIYPVIAMWLPNILLGITGTVLLSKTLKR